MRALLRRIILWALASGNTPVPNAAAEIDALAKELRK